MRLAVVTFLLLASCGGAAPPFIITLHPGTDARQDLPYAPAKATGEDCDEDDAETQALPRESAARAKLHTATCQVLAGQLVFARESTREAFAAGLMSRDEAVVHLAGSRLAALDARIPRVTFTKPADPEIELEELTFDRRPVPLDLLEKKYSVDPGAHLVMASARHRRTEAVFEMDVEVWVGEAGLTTIPVVLSVRHPSCSCFPSQESD